MANPQNDIDLRQKLCPLCGKPMKKIHIEAAHRNYNLWTCVPCVREGDKKVQRRCLLLVGEHD